LRATLALPLDGGELLETMGTSIVRNSPDQADSVPSTMMEPLETIDDWLLSFMNCDFESTDEESNKSGPLPLLEDAHRTIPPKQPHVKHSLSPEALYIPSDLTVMMSEEEGQQRRHVNEERNSDEDAMSIDEEGDIEDSPQSDNMSKVAINVMGGSFYTQEDEKKELEIATPLMTDTPTAASSSSYSEPSPATPSPQSSPKSGTGIYTCPQCPNKSFPRMCDFT
jgi:hypothetical protein